MSYQKTYRIIKPDKWYIVDTYRPDRRGKPRMLKKEFDNKKQVERCIAEVIELKQENLYRFDSIKGSEAIRLGIYIINAFPNLKVYLRKYNYEPYMMTEQAKKSYRTKFRRQNRNKQKSGELYKKWG